MRRFWIAALAAVPLLAYLALKTPAADHYLLRHASGWAARWGVDLEVGDLDFDPWGPSLVLTDVTAAGSDGGWRVGADTLRLRLRFLKSLSGALHLELEAVAPRLTGTIAGLGAGTGAGTGGGGGGAILPRVVFETLRVEGGAVDVSVPAWDLAVKLPSVAVDWIASQGGGAIEGGRVTWRGGTERIDRISFRGRRRFAALQVAEAVLETERVRAAVHGKVGPWSLLDLTGELRLHSADLPDPWVEALGLGDFRPIAATATLTGHLTGSREHPEATGSLSVASGRFGPVMVAGVEVELAATRTGLTFRELAARTDVGEVRGAAGALAWDDGLRLEARGEAVDYDLRRFMALFPSEDGYFPVGVLASGTFEAAGPLWPHLALACRVEARARDLDVTTEEGGRATRHFALPTARVTSECTVGADELEFGATRIETPSATVVIDTGRIEYRKGLWFDTDVTVRDLELVRQYVPAGFGARGSARGRFGGPYRSLRFEYDLDLAATVVFGVDVGRLRAHATYDLEDLVVRDGRLDGPLGRIAASGSVGLRPDGRYDLEVEGRELDLARVGAFVAETPVGPMPEVLGTAHASGALGGPLAAPVFDGSVGTGPVTVAGRWRVDDVEAEGSASADGWVLRRGTVRAYGGTVEAEGRGDVQAFTARADVSGLTLARLEEAVGRPIPARGSVVGSLSATGPYRAPRVEGSGRATDLVVDGVSVGEAAVEFRVAGGRLAATVSAFDGTASARTRIGLSEPYPAEVVVTAREVPWSVLPAGPLPPGLQGRSLTGSGRLSVSLARGGDDLTGRWQATLAGARWQDVDLAAVRTEGEIDGDGVRGSLSAWDGEARLNGVYPKRAGAPLELDATLAALDLARLRGVLPVAAGKASGTGRVLLSVGRWQAETGLGRLAALADLSVDARLSGLEFAGTVPATVPDLAVRVRSPSGRPRMTLSGDGIEAEAELVDPASAAWRAKAHWGGFRPASFVPPGSPLGPLEGTLTGTASAQGKGTAVTAASVEGTVDGVAYGPVGPTRWAIDGGWTDGEAELTAREGRGIELTTHWVPGGSLSAEATLEGVPLAGLFRDGEVPEELSGTVDGRAALRWAAGAGPEGDVVLTRLEASLPPVELRNRGDVRLRYRGGELQVERLAVAGEGIDARVSGGLRPGEQWDLAGEGAVDLAALRRWVPMVRRASGTARGRVSVQGPWAEPSFEGPVEIRPGATVQLEGLAYPFEDLDASAYLRGDQGFTVEWVDAQFGAGRIHVEGSVGLDGLQPGSLRLSAEIRDVHYESPPQVSYSGDADLLVTGTARRPEVRGEIRVEEFLYARRLNWKSMVFDFLERRPREVGAVAEPGAVYVDVSVRGSEDLRVENNLADLSLAVDLRARGYLPRPTLWGRVSVVDGTVQFRSQEYEVLQSAVEFLGETQPAPLLDVHARTTVQDHTISVDIVGPLDDYQVTLASVPPLSQTDIVALLTLGTTSEEVGAGQSVTAAEAASFLTGRLQDELESEVGGLLGFDQLQIDPVYSPAAQTTVPRITVGKTVTKDLRARYSAAVGGETEQYLEVQYTLNPRLSLLGTWSDRGPESRGSLGGEVRFRFTFR